MVSKRVFVVSLKTENNVKSGFTVVADNRKQAINKAKKKFSMGTNINIEVQRVKEITDKINGESLGEQINNRLNEG